MYENEHPLWLGSVQPQTQAQVSWAESMDRKLHEIVVVGHRPIVLIGRNSGSAGRSGAREAAKNLHEAARAMSRRCGFDVVALLPSIDELVEMLMASANVVKSRDQNQREFKNRFVLLDYSEHGFIVSLSTGSAHKLDDELNQPHVRWIQRLMRDLNPAGFFASKFNRVSRVMWQTGLLIEELQALESRTGSVWACDDQYGMWSTSDDAAIMHAIRGQQASTEAKEFRRNGTRAQVNLAGEKMIDGQVSYSLATGIPAGLFAYRNRRTGRMVLSIDSPGYYPEPDDVLYGLPDVRDENNELVDQAENICWFLREFAKPGVTLAEMVRGLVKRRYSTQWLRTLTSQQPSSYYGGDSRPVGPKATVDTYSLMRSILNNLEMYETGILRRSVGPDDDHQIVIREVFPDGGSWGPPAVFSAIRVKLEDYETRSESVRSWSWSGMPVVVNGVLGELRPRRVHSTSEMGWHPYFSRPVASQVLEAEATGASEGSSSTGAGAGKGSQGPRHGIVPPIPDKMLTAAMTQALIDADGKPLTPHLSAEPVTDDAETAQRELAQLQSQLQVDQAARQRCVDAIVTGAVAGGLLAGVQARHDKFEASIVSLERKIDSARRRADALVAARVGIDVTAMSALVAGLANPETNRYRAHLRGGVTDLTVTSTRIEHNQLVGTKVEVAGRLVFDVDGTAYELPFGFNYQNGLACEVETLALERLKAMRAGTVMRYVDNARGSRAVGMRMAELLGVKTTEFALGACNDSRLLRLGMAALFPSPVAGEDPASVVSVADLCADPAFVADFGDVAELARRIEAHYGAYRNNMWLRFDRATETAALIAAATSRHFVRAGDPSFQKELNSLRASLRKSGQAHRWSSETGVWPVLAPCRFCDSSTMASMRLGEVTGYLCLESTCRRDEAGVRWPSRFDRYISNPQQWVDAGVELDLPPGFDGKAKSMTGVVSVPAKAAVKWRSMQDLDDAERRKIIAAYMDRSRLTSEIMATFRIHPKTLYAVIKANGNVQPRNSGRAHFHRPRDSKDREGQVGSDAAEPVASSAEAEGKGTDRSRGCKAS